MTVVNDLIKPVWQKPAHDYWNWDKSSLAVIANYNGTGIVLWHGGDAI